MKWLIYTLKNPRVPDRVRYVGRTVNTERRMENHIGYAIRLPHKTPAYSWILSLLSMGLMPLMEVVESDADDRAEQKWIDYYRAIGAPLLNVTNGGGGTLGWGTPEQRTAKAKKAMASRTPEQRSASARKTRAGLTPEQRAANLKKYLANVTFEERSAIRKKVLAAKTPEERVAMARRAHAGRTAEQNAAFIAQSKAAAQRPRPKSKARWAALRLAKQNNQAS